MASLGWRVGGEDICLIPNANEPVVGAASTFVTVTEYWTLLPAHVGEDTADDE